MAQVTQIVCDAPRCTSKKSKDDTVQDTWWKIVQDGDAFHIYGADETFSYRPSGSQTGSKDVDVVVKDVCGASCISAVLSEWLERRRRLVMECVSATSPTK